MSIAQLRTGNLASARKIARSLGQTEAAIDASIVEQAGLLTAIVEGRRVSGSAIQVGHSAFRRAASALEALALARDHVVACHDDLAGVRDHFRMDASEVGCTPDKVTGSASIAVAA